MEHETVVNFRHFYDYLFFWHQFSLSPLVISSKEENIKFTFPSPYRKFGIILMALYYSVFLDISDSVLPNALHTSNKVENI